jgi:hypothetical protein
MVSKLKFATSIEVTKPASLADFVILGALLVSFSALAFVPGTLWQRLTFVLLTSTVLLRFIYVTLPDIANARGLQIAIAFLSCAALLLLALLGPYKRFQRRQNS